MENFNRNSIRNLNEVKHCPGSNRISGLKFISIQWIEIEVADGFPNLYLYFYLYDYFNISIQLCPLVSQPGIFDPIFLETKQSLVAHQQESVTMVTTEPWSVAGVGFFGFFCPKNPAVFWPSILQTRRFFGQRKF